MSTTILAKAIKTVAVAMTGLAAVPAAAVVQMSTFGFIGPYVQTFIAPVTATYDIYAAGAAGGGSSNITDFINVPFVRVAGGKGAVVGGRFDLVGGSVLSLIVGEIGRSYPARGFTGAFEFPLGGGGGGGSFVYQAGTGLLIAAGGGGGAGNQAAFLGGDGVLGPNGSAFGVAVGGIAGSGGSGGAQEYNPGTKSYLYGGGGGAGWLSDGNGGGNIYGVGGIGGSHNYFGASQVDGLAYGGGEALHLRGLAAVAVVAAAAGTAAEAVATTIAAPKSDR